MVHLIVDETVDVNTDREDGTPWPYVATITDTSTLLADTPTDVLAWMINGYGDLPDDPSGDDEALAMRVQFAVHVATEIQALMCVDATSEGRFPAESDDEEILTALLGDRTLPVRGVKVWTHDIPLVLLATDYSPFTPEPAPEGNVLLIDPSDESMFVQSLAGVGALNLYVHEDA